jgi:hypothetical protein
MTNLMKILAGTAGVAAIATAAPASAQYYSRYYSPYAYGAVNTQAAASQCTAAVQNRLYNRTGLSGIVGSLFGMSGTSARVLSITQVTPNRTFLRVRGLATSGRYSYNPYGAGYYGALASGYVPDLAFKCDVDYRGYVRDVDINRR